MRDNFCRHCGCTNDVPCQFDEGATTRRCAWKDTHFTLCTAPACIAWLRQFLQPALDALRSTKCVCGRHKTDKMSICRHCWKALPWEIAGRLYISHFNGYALYYFDALRWLREHTIRLSHVDDAETLRLIDEVIGKAGRERAA